MEDLRQMLSSLQERVDSLKKAININARKAKSKELEAQTTDPAFWQNQERARLVMQEIGSLKEEVKGIEVLEGKIADLTEIVSNRQFREGLAKEIEVVERELSNFEILTFLSGPYDRDNAIIAIHAGQGGVEAMDWVSMLFRMYMRFCEREGWRIEVVDQTPGEEAGIKSIVFRVEGPYAFGKLKHEAGTHRLVRQSPFNADKLRQTSFALVEVLPEFKETDLPEIEVREDDLDWQFFRASSQGGQNVQKVSTAVRVTHKPTGITVSAQTERFQEQNRKIALSILKARLWGKEQERLEKEKKLLKGDYHPASWGTQIRSYVLHPYKMVKDLRTQVESSNPEVVLDGELDEFINASVRSKI